MSDIKACRICLRTEAKLYKYDQFHLIYYYEEVMALKINVQDGLPHYFCYECATILHKFHKFKEKCYSGQKTLKEIAWKGPITYEAIYKVDRPSRYLKSPLEILILGDRVKSYFVRDETDELEDKVANENAEQIEKIEIEVDYNNISDNSLAEADDSDLDNDPVNDHKLRDSKKDDADLNVDKVLAEPTSPIAVFVDVKKEIKQLKKEEIKDKKRSRQKKNLQWVHFKESKKLLDSNHWKKYELTEEEAVKEFRARAEDKKYLEAAFKCSDCFRGFSKKEMLTRHTYLRHRESIGNFECRFCRMRYKLDCYLRKHMKSHYTKYECLRCNMICPVENTAILHEEYHSGVTRKCVHCNEEFKHMSTYYSHMRTHRSEFVCTLCGVSFVSDAGLHMHKKAKHLENEIESFDDDDEVLNTFCDRCNIKFESRRAYEEHLFHSALHTEVKGDVLPVSAAPRKILGKKGKEKVKSELREKHPLDEDRNIIIQVNSKRRKRSRKAIRKPTTCHQCGKHFETQAACMKHHVAEHPRTSFFPSTERHICELCGASLAPGSVAAHQNIHTRQTVHTCDTCGKQFHSSIGLKRHTVTHTGEKPFGCPLCSKRFTQSNSMKLHYRTFHLKQPYPKRNRRKKKDEIKEAEVEESASESDSLPEQEMTSLDPQTGIKPATTAPENHIDDNMHYLTLT